MIQSCILTDAFKSLYSRHKPAFATLHLNDLPTCSIATGAPPACPLSRRAQPHRPALLRDRGGAQGLRRVADWIERSLIWTDQLLGELLELVDDDAIHLVGTALGQKPHDPVYEIHNPVVRLVREGERDEPSGSQARVSLRAFSNASCRTSFVKRTSISLNFTK